MVWHRDSLQHVLIFTDLLVMVIQYEEESGSCSGLGGWSMGWDVILYNLVIYFQPPVFEENRDRDRAYEFRFEM